MMLSTVNMSTPPQSRVFHLRGSTLLLPIFKGMVCSIHFLIQRGQQHLNDLHRSEDMGCRRIGANLEIRVQGTWWENVSM